MGEKRPARNTRREAGRREGEMGQREKRGRERRGQTVPFIAGQAYLTVGWSLEGMLM